jgi:ribosomal protein L28
VVGWAYTGRMRETSNEYRIFMEANRRSRRRWKSNIDMALRKIG